MSIQTEYISRVKNLAVSGDFAGLDAIMVGGSAGSQSCDNLSDVDFFLLVTEEKLHEFLKRTFYNFISQIGEYLLVWGPTRDGKFSNSFSVYFTDRLMCSFHIDTVSGLSPNLMMKSPSIILFDRNENYDKIIKSSLSLKYNPKDILITSFNHFWFRALSVSKDIKRNEIMLAFFHMRDMQNEIMILMRVVHGSYPVGMNYLRPAKRFERDMPEEVIKNISKSFCIYNKEHVIKAFTYCVDFYCKEFSEYVTKQKWLNLCEDRDVLKIQKQIVQILRDDKSLF